MIGESVTDEVYGSQADAPDANGCVYGVAGSEETAVYSCGDGGRVQREGDDYGISGSSKEGYDSEEAGATYGLTSARPVSGTYGLQYRRSRSVCAPFVHW